MRSKRSVDIRRLYAFYNRKYFGHRLPRQMMFIGFHGKQLPRGELGNYVNEHGRAEFRTKSGKRDVYPGPLIMLRTDEPFMIVKHTLLHEMVHASGVMNHGPRFQKEMLRLANEGAFNGIW